MIKDFQRTADFIAELRYEALQQRRPIRLLFGGVKNIYPAALLLLTAQIHQCRLIHGSHRIDGTYPDDPRVQRMLRATGFFKLLDIRSPVESQKSKISRHHIEFVSDNKLAEDSVRKLRVALLGDEMPMNILARKKLFRAISEAMINVGQHAYPSEYLFKDRTPGRWWLSGQVDKRFNRLLIAFCDLGIGIPATLPKLYTWERIRSALSILPTINPNDGEMIRAGMTIGRSQTGQTHRGKGLNDLRSFIDLSEAGELHILSSHGLYRYRPDGSEKVQNYSTAVPGTLIKWSVPLDKVTSWSSEDDSDQDKH